MNANDDIDVLRSELAAERRQLDALEAVELAESLVRRAYSNHLQYDLYDTWRQLDAAIDLVTRVRAGDDLIAILDAEQGLCAVQRQAQVIQALHERHLQAAASTDQAYKATRRRALQRIEQCRSHLKKKSTADAG